MNIIDSLKLFSNRAVRYVSGHSKWFYGIGSAVIYLAIVIPATITSGFNLMFTVAMLFAALIIGWPMMLIYLLPFGLIQLFCYCVRHPKEALITTIKLVFSFIALGALAIWLRAVLYGNYED